MTGMKLNKTVDDVKYNEYPLTLKDIILNPQNLSKVTFQNNILPLYMKMDHACTMSGSRFS
jgi:hypothetical protein